MTEKLVKIKKIPIKILKCKISKRQEGHRPGLYIEIKIIITKYFVIPSCCMTAVKIEMKIVRVL